MSPEPSDSPLSVGAARRRWGPSVYRAAVLGSSAGGMDALLLALTKLPEDFPIPLLIVQHLHKTDEGRFATMLDSRLALNVAEARDEQPIEPGHVYVAPGDYHLLVEREKTLALSVDPTVRWARPSIDVLFESAARALARALIGVVLSGANDDGARGLQLIQSLGGHTIAQDPATAESSVMPRAAIARGGATEVLSPEQIGNRLVELAGARPSAPAGGLDG